MTVMSNGDPLVGHVLDGRYEILRKLARGGMATVYLASDRRLTRTVAVKVMHDTLGDDADFVARFDREARAAARLSHPNVVSVFDQGMDGGRPYMVMEYVEGSTLRHVISREAPIDPARALDLLLPVIGAVAAAHEAGIIHRDLKPENVLISDRGQVKVADFGLARAVTAQTATATGMLIGTVSYIAPELVTKGKADTRCDVYALGVILFEMLTGRKPHTGDSPIQVAYSHVHNEIPAPSSQMTSSWRDSRNGIPPYLDALVTTAAARDPQTRPRDARVLFDHARQAREALGQGVMDDPALTALMLRTVLDPAAQLTEPVPSLSAAGTEVSRTATLRFTPSTPTSPGHPPVADAMPYYDDALPPLTPSAVPAQRRQARRRKGGLVTLVIVVLLATALGFGTWWFFQGRFTPTPDFVQLTQTKAEALAKDHGLTLRFSSEYSETVPAGQVIRTAPVAGAPVLHGGTVAAFLSKGQERYPVPSMVGMTVTEATAALQAGHLALGVTSEVFDDAAVIGTVVSASFEAGKKVKPGTEVDLKISKGPAPVEVVSYVKKPFADAKKHFEAQGLIVEMSQEKFHDTIPAGSVISQDPSRGNLEKGDTIRFVVSKGPELVEVPSVSYKSVDEATQILEDAGFKVKVRHRTKLLDVAAYTDPPSKSLAPKGSTVTIWAV